MASSVNTRRHYDLYLTNDWAGTPHQPVYSTRPSLRGTLRQIDAEIVEFRRVSGGCDIAYYAIDPRTGERLALDAAIAEVRLADLLRGAGR